MFDMAIIECKNVWKVYNQGTPAEVKALQGVDMKIEEGDFVAIMGASGSGKSTLLNCISSLDKPTKGKILVDGQDISHFDEDELAIFRRNKIGFVFQFFNLIPGLTVLQNVELPMIFKGIAEPERKERAENILKQVELEKKISSKPNELSGGESQRVAIARALANNPVVIFADEPTGNLDSKSGKNVMEILKKLNEDNKTIVLITHDKSIGDQTNRIIKMIDGKVCQ
jgi:putative ABC transport system ATP-binding protein